MKVYEIIEPAQQQVANLKQVAKQSQQRAKQAALRLKLQKTQQQLAQANKKI